MLWPHINLVESTANSALGSGVIEGEEPSEQAGKAHVGIWAIPAASNSGPKQNFITEAFFFIP